MRWYVDSRTNTLFYSILACTYVPPDCTQSQINEDDYIIFSAYVFGFGVNNAIESQIRLLSTDSTSYYVGVPFSQMEKYIQKIKGKICEKATPGKTPGS